MGGNKGLSGGVVLKSNAAGVLLFRGVTGSSVKQCRTHLLVLAETCAR